MAYTCVAFLAVINTREETTYRGKLCCALQFQGIVHPGRKAWWEESEELVIWQTCEEAGSVLLVSLRSLFSPRPQPVA